MEIKEAQKRMIEMAKKGCSSSEEAARRLLVGLAWGRRLNILDMRAFDTDNAIAASMMINHVFSGERVGVDNKTLEIWNNELDELDAYRGR